MKIFLYTTLALVAFALNSILCRLALRGEEADAAGFTAVRLISGAIALVVINYAISCRGLGVSKGDTLNAEDSSRGLDQFGSLSPLLTRGLAQHVGALSGSWLSAVLLFAYAVCFSFAYLGLTAGTGALVLFGSVQLTMIAVSLVRGERPHLLEILGLIAAVGGLVYLVFPGLQSPPLTSSLLMAAAGAAWGVYTLRGRKSSDAIANTTGNFIRSVPMIAAVALIFLPNLHLSGYGILLAVLSGAITSGVGYSFWYAALPHHTAFRAAVLQLPVPLLTALFGIVLLAEAFTARLLVASILVLGGIGLTVVAEARTK